MLLLRTILLEQYCIDTGRQSGKKMFQYVENTSMLRKTVLATDEIYHTYNRGVEKRTIFIFGKDYKRLMELVNYYRFANCPMRFSYFTRLKKEEKSDLLQKLEEDSKKLVNILAFCLMSNHIHFLLKQVVDRGITRFMAKVTNGYSHYFNTKYKRIGHLFQGNFGAVRIETDEQFVHISRYIHLNPVTSHLIEFKDLANYKWSSYPEYIRIKKGFSNTQEIMKYFKNIESYKEFVEDQVDYVRELENINHLTLED